MWITSCDDHSDDIEDGSYDDLSRTATELVLRERIRLMDRNDDAAHVNATKADKCTQLLPKLVWGMESNQANSRVQYFVVYDA